MAQGTEGASPSPMNLPTATRLGPCEIITTEELKRILASGGVR
jgi:hypothetical protein